MLGTMIRAALGACAAALLAVAVPANLAQAQTKLRCQSAFPPTSILFESSRVLVERVRALSGGRLEIEMLTAGAVVPPFEVLDATHRKILDCAQSGSAYWVGRNRAATLFGPAPGGPFGMDTMDYLAWLTDGGGQALYEEFYRDVLRRNVQVIPMTTAGPQSLGWFRTPVRSWEDLRGRKCRQTGITAEVFGRSGMATVNMPGGEILPAAERGVIDCAEWVGPADDLQLGFHTVFKHFYLTSVHEPATIAELLINGDVWNGLPRDFQEIIRAAALEATIRSLITLNVRNGNAVAELRERHGVTVHRTPEDILKRTLEAWDQIVREEEARNPFFKKVADSQRAFAARVVATKRLTHPDYRLGADHYWPEGR
jgi:TRAP-type mannitol/chloroaromatic compound transport system substrate-binding protein